MEGQYFAVSTAFYNGIRLSLHPGHVIRVRATVQSRQALRRHPTTFASRRLNQHAPKLEELGGKERGLKRWFSWAVILMSWACRPVDGCAGARAVQAGNCLNGPKIYLASSEFYCIFVRFSQFPAQAWPSLGAGASAGVGACKCSPLKNGVWFRVRVMYGYLAYLANIQINMQPSQINKILGRAKPTK